MKEQRLPQNGKEGFLYGGTICLITVIVMLILNISTSLNKFDLETLIIVAKNASYYLDCSNVSREFYSWKNFIYISFKILR